MNKHHDNTKVTLPYALLTTCYWMSFCVSIGYAALYLQKMGYTNSVIGIILACGSILGACVAPFLGGLCDRYRRLRAFHLFVPLTVIRGICLAALLCSYEKGPVTAVAYGAYIAFSIPVNSLNLKICIDYERTGAGLNYGLARGCGSFGYVIISAILGVLVESVGIISIPVGGLVLLIPESLMQLFSDRQIRHLRTNGGYSGEEVNGGTEKSSALIPFLKQNRYFALFLLGSVLVFFSHSADCNFLIVVTENVGGGSVEMGYINAFTAMVEVPVLVLYSRFLGRYNINRLMLISLVMFVFKILAYTLAPTITWLFIARLLQGPSYALYMAVSVPYVKKTVAAKDAARAQSLAFTMSTAGSVLASVVCGWLYDVQGCTNTMWIATAVCLLGSAIAVIGVKGRIQGGVKNNAR